MAFLHELVCRQGGVHTSMSPCPTSPTSRRRSFYFLNRQLLDCQDPSQHQMKARKKSGKKSFFPEDSKSLHVNTRGGLEMWGSPLVNLQNPCIMLISHNVRRALTGVVKIQLQDKDKFWINEQVFRLKAN